MAGFFDTSALMQAISLKLASMHIQPRGYDVPLSFKIVMAHPTSVADFGDKKIVFVLTDYEVVPPVLIDRIVVCNLQVAAWSIDGSVTRYAIDKVCETLSGTSDLCGDGFQLVKPLMINAIQPTTFEKRSELWYRTIRFRALAAI